MTENTLQVAGWARCLFKEPDLRHIVAHGGRGAGAKSRSIAAYIIHEGYQRPFRVLCAREIQRSIRDSVKVLLDDEIARQHLGNFYVSTERGIFGANGTRIIFMGLRANTEQIKSLEGIDLVWIEEARTVSQESIDVLEPTIRKDGSRLVWSFNAKEKTDPVDKMFRGPDGPPPRSKVIHLQPEDNPWFPEVLREKMEYDKKRDYARYLHIWRGKYWERSDSKVFTNWKEAEFETPANAILRFGADWGFAIDPTVLVRCFLGWWDEDTGTATADHKGDTLFIDYEAWSIKCDVLNTPALFAGDDDPGRLKKRWTNPKGYTGIPGATKWKITADSARPEMISHMKNHGFSIEPAVKGAGSIEDGVEFLKGYNIIIHPRCRNVIDEVGLYSYKVDPVTEEVLPVLADKDNNTIDACRYALEGVRRAGTGKLNVKSAGTRVSVSGTQARDGRQQEKELQTPKRTGRGWGSAGGGLKGVNG